MENALKYPDYIKYKNSKQKNYKYIKEEKEYIVVIIRILNGEGFVITSYMTSKIEK